jgi:hypothetical protein
MARKDFAALRGMLGSPLFADEFFGFHAQQAIEKLRQLLGMVAAATGLSVGKEAGDDGA